MTRNISTFIELELEVTYSISPYHAATMYNRNGDPGSPEEGGIPEIETITYRGIELDLDTTAYASIIRSVEDDASQLNIEDYS